MRRKIYATVDVEVGLEDFDDDAILEICEERGLSFGAFDEQFISDMIAAFKMGREDIVVARVRELIQDAKGVIL